jgi:hypothetical protein
MMLKAFVLSGLAFGFTSQALAQNSDNPKKAVFNWYTCVLHTDPWHEFTGRGKTLEKAKAAAVNACDGGDEAEIKTFCELRLSQYQFVCRFNPGWDK